MRLSIFLTALLSFGATIAHAKTTGIRGADGLVNQHRELEDSPMDPEEWALKEQELSFKELSLEDLLNSEHADNEEGHRSLALTASGWYFIKNHHEENRYLHKDGNNVGFPNSSNAHRFYFEPTSWGATRIKDDSGNCVDYDFSTGNVWLHPCHGGINQDWHFIGTSWSNVEIKTAHEWKCLDMDLDGNILYSNAIGWDCNGQSNQRFMILS